MKSEVEVLVEGLDHPECVAWGPDGYLYAGGEEGQIYKIDVAKRTTELVGSTGGFILGIALDANRNVYACDSARHAVIRVGPDGTSSIVTNGTADRPMVAPNYPVFTRSGRLFVTDCGTWQEDDGCVYVREPDGTTRVWATEARRFPNGLALNRDETFLYVVESTGERVVRFPIMADGTAGSMEIVIDLPRNVPDGLAFDSSGGLLISCYRPDTIHYLDVDGSLSTFADDYCGTLLAAPTNVSFGGELLETVYIANLGRWHIAQVRVTTPGQPLNYPDFK